MTDREAKATLVLVGRQHELDSLWNQFEQSITGLLRVALVAGEPGIGKTRLLQELARRAEQTGIPVLRGGTSEAEGMPPYLPFLEALGQHIRAASPDELRAQTGAMAAVLATILPELSLCLGELSSNYELPPEQARLCLYEAVGMFIAAIAAPHGMLLLLDDLQWADAATLDLLCHIARSQPNAHLFILGAYREGEITHNFAFERALTELNRFRQLTTIRPGPLNETAFALREESYVISVLAAWDGGEAQRHVAWARAWCRALSPHARSGVYVNFLGNEGEEPVRAAYGVNYERLVALKNTYDPTNFFSLNQNIRPMVSKPHSLSQVLGVLAT